MQEAVEVTEQYVLPTGLRKETGRTNGWKPVSESDIHVFTLSGDPIPRVDTIRVLDVRSKPAGNCSKGRRPRPESSEETRASLSPRFPPCATEPSDESHVAPSASAILRQIQNDKVEASFVDAAAYRDGKAFAVSVVDTLGKVINCASVRTTDPEVAEQELLLSGAPSKESSAQGASQCGSSALLLIAM
ncbi:hypothetical protein HPB50_004468 [Hyalomma asiaticum]|uniref:Uncharacterized protein n=1 Tax=Hyalomma asiaticum TaxID=266040 RepID=A0ACB7S0P6_HYAAI|nr:hypothetical protein HPB50_004468 [Hyalomma asiaticum]